MDIEQFNIKCCEILKNIKEEDGLYGYYNERINNKEVLNIDDQLLIKYFIENVDKKCNILEIAAGLGQLSHYLNLNEFNNITINECEKKRLGLVCKLNNELGNNCITNLNKYQSLDLNNYDYIFTLNGVSSHLGNLNDLPIFENFLDNGKKIILKEGYFGKTGDTSFTDKLKEKYNYEILFETNTSILMFFK
jgi:hypothetical protein